MEKLTAQAQNRVRFDEVDSMKIVWHGNYAKYFEDARVAFGEKYQLDYMYMFSMGFYAPLVKMDFKFVNPLVFGDSFITECEYVPCDEAKILFKYRITRAKDGALVATGSTTQVFLDKEYKLSLYNPEFYVEWKKMNGIL